MEEGNGNGKRPASGEADGSAGQATPTKGWLGERALESGLAGAADHEITSDERETRVKAALAAYAKQARADRVIRYEVPDGKGGYDVIESWTPPYIPTEVV